MSGINLILGIKILRALCSQKVHLRVAAECTSTKVKINELAFIFNYM